MLLLRSAPAPKAANLLRSSTALPLPNGTQKQFQTIKQALKPKNVAAAEEETLNHTHAP